MISDQTYRQWVLILLALIAIFLLIFVLGIIYSAVTIGRTVNKVNTVVDDVSNITSAVNVGVQNFKDDLSNVRANRGNVVQNWVNDARQALPRFFNWLQTR